ncbi:MAG TPA: N-acetylmuramoyl-L-alanine amidase [Candidatus Egerieisoma faecipullorum]|uniref:N-acetylmuramoyl-L-alanine amidase n=1 Tax=Candidatus Egerieisoma faecipullorum TaxID=2840963 RepID=A0A9D1L9W6_9CLOT|nr:N-acetylmuramoyl-L-alanine amidase [Candidatus Egerieisoma faecipullorum]
MTGAIRKKFLSVITVLFLLAALTIPSGAAEETVIVLDAGHGGNDNGTQGTLNGTTYYEKNLNLKVTRYLWDALGEYGGVKVYMTRYEDTKLSILSRAKAAADLNADLMVSLHMNALEGADYFGGSEIFVPAGNYRPELAEEASAIAEKILSEFEGLGMKKIGVKTSLLSHDDYYDYPNGQQADYYGIIRFCVQENIPSMIIEHGYLSNKADLTFLSKDANLKALAEATAASIAEHYGLSKGSGTKITLQEQAPVVIADLPTQLTVGDEPITMRASGGSGNGEMRFESNDKNVLQVVGDQLVIVGEGKANITAVKGTDGTYLPMTSENYIRITVEDSGAAPITPEPEPATPTPNTEPTGSAGGQESPSGTGTEPGSPQESAQSNPQEGQNDTFPLIAAIVGGILAALLTAIIIRILVVRRRRKKSNTRKYKNNKNRTSRGRQQRNYRR